MRFDDILVDHMGRVTEDLDYMPLSDPFDENSEPVKAQLSRLTCKNIIWYSLLFFLSIPPHKHGDGFVEN